GGDAAPAGWPPSPRRLSPVGRAADSRREVASDRGFRPGGGNEDIARFECGSRSFRPLFGSGLRRSGGAGAVVPNACGNVDKSAFFPHLSGVEPFDGDRSFSASDVTPLDGPAVGLDV